jgi:flagellar basal-body rod protein FlgC
MIGALHAAVSGVAAGVWSMSAAGDSTANASTERPGGEAPYRSSRVELAPRPSAGGVSAVAVTQVGGDPAVVHDPSNPLADAQGYVTRPAVELAAEMTQTLLAQRFVQANLTTLRAAHEAYRNAVRLGVLAVGRVES